jgi:hypothetical protein
MPSPPFTPLAVICSQHGRTVAAVPGEHGPVIVHVGGNGNPYCAGVGFVITRREKADRAGVLAVLGEDGDHD